MHITNIEVNGSTDPALLQKLLQGVKNGTPKRQTSIKKKQTKRTCYICHNFGHIASNCRLNKKTTEATEDKGKSAAFSRRSPKDSLIAQVSGGLKTDSKTCSATPAVRKQRSISSKQNTSCQQSASQSHQQPGNAEMKSGVNSAMEVDEQTAAPV